MAAHVNEVQHVRGCCSDVCRRGCGHAHIVQHTTLIIIPQHLSSNRQVGRQAGRQAGESDPAN